MVFLWRAVVVIAAIGGGAATMYFFSGRLIALPGLVLFLVLAWFAEGRLVERKVDDIIRERIGARHTRRTGGTSA
jgi:hypothetical protein